LRDKNNPNGYFVNTSSTTKVYTNADTRDTAKFEDFTPADLLDGIIDLDVNFKKLFSDYSEYGLSNNTIIKIKPVISNIQQTRFYSQDG
jgi:hypothetical protein